jgi:hypothetical protein
LRVAVLIEMADLSHLAGRHAEAVSYAERAVLGASGRGEELEALAKGAWATAAGSLETLRQRPAEPWLTCTYMLREHGLLAGEEQEDVATSLRALAARYGLKHFAARLTFAEKAPARAFVS